MSPTYSLEEIKSSLSDGKYILTISGLQGALQMSLSAEDVVDCVCQELRDSHFYKTMPAEKVSGLWQDVYRLWFRGKRVYLKVQINARGKAVIISFKEDTSP
ncbi:MAG TPA: type II toxin-antitoxin system MqsR family toxin [Candidatus Binatus sp.]|uniref:type II toxin-antitoxin system MqsR family toxin n=1 Tax=Candidatus Binatus sp. TaxID=2811406 RepID=UPI002CC1CB59|nr:type II toxin-antitoxin system MqsR family toxin [Candidatus Binatus sp.]